MEKENDKNRPFLNVLLRRTANGTLETVYHNPSHTHTHTPDTKLPQQPSRSFQNILFNRAKHTAQRCFYKTGTQENL